MVGLVGLEFFAAAGAAELVVLRVGVPEADFGLQVPVPAQDPRIAVGDAGPDEPALIPVVGEFRQVAAQEGDAVFQPADVVLAAVGVESEEVARKAVAEPVRASVSSGGRAKASSR